MDHSGSTRRRYTQLDDRCIANCRSWKTVEGGGGEPDKMPRGHGRVKVSVRGTISAIMSGGILSYTPKAVVSRSDSGNFVTPDSSAR